MPRRSTRYRRAPHLAVHLSSDGAVVHNYASGHRVAAAREVVTALLHFDDWRPLDSSLAAKIEGWSEPEVRALVREMARLTLLHRSDRPTGEPDLSAWGEWEPVASSFHYATRDTAPLTGPDLDADDRRFRRKGRRRPPPPPVKRHPGTEVVRLPAAELTGEFAEVLLDRHTWRGFGPGRIALDDLAAVLDLTLGVRHWGRSGERDRVMFTTSPSPGARHPIEAYVLPLRVAGLPRGLYHYLSDEKALERLGSGFGPRRLERLLCGQWWYTPAAVVVFLTAVLPRVRWRYDYPRVYRSVLAEVGHVCQTFCLASTWRGLAPFATMAFEDSRLERALGVDGVDEVVLYVAGAGVRPEGEGWVQWPDHEPGSPYRRPRSERRGGSVAVRPRPGHAGKRRGRGAGA